MAPIVSKVQSPGYLRTVIYVDNAPIESSLKTYTMLPVYRVQRIVIEYVYGETSKYHTTTTLIGDIVFGLV